MLNCVHGHGFLLMGHILIFLLCAFPILLRSIFLFLLCVFCVFVPYPTLSTSPVSVSCIYSIAQLQSMVQLKVILMPHACCRLNIVGWRLHHAFNIEWSPVTFMPTSGKLSGMCTCEYYIILYKLLNEYYNINSIYMMNLQILSLCVLIDPWIHCPSYHGWKAACMVCWCLTLHNLWTK